MDTCFDSVCNCLSKNKRQFHCLDCGPAGKALVVPGLARVIGLWTGPAEPSHLWINSPKLQNLDMPKDSWLNSGGHRIWIAPERQFFIRDLGDPFGTYMVPSAIDPGSWTSRTAANCVEMSTTTSVRAYGLDKQIPITITRKTQALSTLPYKIPSTQIVWAGYKETVSLQTDFNMKIGLWSLLQVPLGGDVLIPSHGGYTEFFGSQSGLLQKNPGSLRIKYEIDRKLDFKIGLKASALSHNMFYYEIPGRSGIRILVVEFENCGDSAYVDHPWPTPGDTGYLLQFFFGGNWGFGELEIHGPCRLSNTSSCSELKSTVLAFDCPYDYVDDLKRMLVNNTGKLE
jgi:hypothetical protein